MDQLSPFGWTTAWNEKWQALALTGMVPARVIADFGTSLKIATPEVISAELSGKLAHYTAHEEAPKVGDWVAVCISDSGAVIESVIPRRSEIARKVAGKRAIKQIIAANVDIAFVLLALDNDFSIERLKRFLYQLSVHSIEPVIVLNKADKTDDVAGYVDSIRALGVPIVVSAATEGRGADAILAHIQPGKTAILLGSSGVGKSTLTNLLLGREAQATQAVRSSDDTGKHTTVHRELFVLPGGGLLIDTPGIRELQLWGTEEDLNDNFDDIAALISQCKYTTCSHISEPHCAIRAALQSGTLAAAHYASYVKMKQELSGLNKKQTVRLALNNQRSRKNTARRDQERLDDNWHS
jgi:ribosome biogenesis GTPase / thiamine phosphate phosphatase